MRDNQERRKYRGGDHIAGPNLRWRRSPPSQTERLEARIHLTIMRSKYWQNASYRCYVNCYLKAPLVYQPCGPVPCCKGKQGKSKKQFTKPTVQGILSLSISQVELICNLQSWSLVKIDTVLIKFSKWDSPSRSEWRRGPSAAARGRSGGSSAPYSNTASWNQDEEEISILSKLSLSLNRGQYYEQLKSLSCGTYNIQQHAAVRMSVTCATLQNWWEMSKPIDCTTSIQITSGKGRKKYTHGSWWRRGLELKEWITITSIIGFCDYQILWHIGFRDCLFW